MVDFTIRSHVRNFMETRKFLGRVPHGPASLLGSVSLKLASLSSVCLVEEKTKTVGKL